MTIGIMSAMHQEIDALLEKVNLIKKERIGKRTYYFATHQGKDLVLVFSRWGKVAASATASCLILKYKVDEIIFSGVAGALNSSLNVGDIVLGDKLYQHDLDPRPMLQKFEIPLLEKTFLEVNPSIQNKLESASNLFLEKEVKDILDKSSFKHLVPKLRKGDIGTGDQFINSNSEKERIIQELPNLFCAEMEGASVAQVCYEYSIPFGIIRTISDSANDNAHLDFPLFVEEIASKYTRGILINYLKSI